jgi:hypothetical protein
MLTEYVLTIFIATAAQYGEGASGKAVSTYFERLKREPHWNLANSIADNNNSSPVKGASGRKPRAQKTTPAKKPAVRFARLNLQRYH